MYSAVLDNDVDDLCATFSTSTSNPWNGRLEEVLLGGRTEEVDVTEDNKVSGENTIAYSLQFSAAFRLGVAEN